MFDHKKIRDGFWLGREQARVPQMTNYFGTKIEMMCKSPAFVAFTHFFDLGLEGANSLYSVKKFHYCAHFANKVTGQICDIAYFRNQLLVIQ